MATYHAPDHIPVPPPDAKVYNTACQYCIVACGYKAYVWPATGSEGGSRPDENALGASFPVTSQSGQWISPGMYNKTVFQDGTPHHVVLLPDKDCEVNRGNHSPRGGTSAQSIWSPFGPTSDRIKTPMVKVGGALQPISWNAAIKIAGEVLNYAVSKYSHSGVGLRMYAYHGHENCYAITKLFFERVGTANAAFHNRPSFGGETPGLNDTGIATLPSAYADAEKSDCIVLVGAGAYENQTVLFTEHIIKGVQNGAQLIVVDPRRIFDAELAEARGGLHLQVKPGTDVVLFNAIARVILEQGWEDKEFLAKFLGTRSDIADEDNWRRRKYGMTVEEYRSLVSQDTYSLANAERVTGVTEEAIQAAAKAMAAPKADGTRPRTLMIFEKGLIWGVNYENVASLANVAVLTGSIGKEGAGITRGGGHQEGFVSPVDYPIHHATDTGTDGQTIPNNLDEHIASGEVRLLYTIGSNHAGMTSSSQRYRQVLARRLLDGTQPQTARPDEIIAALKARIDKGGLVHFVQEIYPNLTTQLADLVLPAAAWGEVEMTQFSGERRLRFKDRFMDPPGEAKPDWWIIGQVARAAGYSGFEWQSSEEVFMESSQFTDYKAVVEYARQTGKRPWEVLNEFGTNGIQLPARILDGKLVGTVRLYEDGRFDTKSGKLMFIRSDWAQVEPIYQQLAPNRDEVWVINGRVQELWQTLYTHSRVPFLKDRWPNCALEINPQDAKKWGLESGDLVSISSDRIFTGEAGSADQGSFTAMAYVTDMVPPGVTFAIFAYPDQWANSIAPRWLHPSNPVPPFKLARGKVEKIGETEFKGTVSFKPRNLAPKKG
jgi:arsenite oxidase large subunit